MPHLRRAFSVKVILAIVALFTIVAIWAWFPRGPLPIDLRFLLTIGVVMGAANSAYPDESSE